MAIELDFADTQPSRARVSADLTQGRSGDVIVEDYDIAVWRQAGVWLCLLCALGMCGLVGWMAYQAAAWLGWVR